jgi:hypothetical protein
MFHRKFRYLFFNRLCKTFTQCRLYKSYAKTKLFPSNFYSSVLIHFQISGVQLNLSSELGLKSRFERTNLTFCVVCVFTLLFNANFEDKFKWTADTLIKTPSLAIRKLNLNYCSRWSGFCYFLKANVQFFYCQDLTFYVIILSTWWSIRLLNIHPTVDLINCILYKVSIKERISRVLWNCAAL